MIEECPELFERRIRGISAFKTSGASAALELGTDQEAARPARLVSSPAFSHVAIVPPGATTIYLGGQNAVDEAGQLIGREDAAVQAAKALGNAKLALAAAGAGFEDVLQWNVLLVDGTDINSVYGVIGPQLASDSPPLVTAAFITQLGVPGALIEISAVAARLAD